MKKVSHVAARRPGAERPSGRTERPVTVRLDEHRLQFLTALALIDETTIAEQIRQASETYAVSRARDPELTQQVDDAVVRFRRHVTTVLGRDGDASADADPQPMAPAPPARDMSTERSVTLRLSNQTFDYFTGLSILDGFTLADELRGAIDQYVTARRQDPELDAKIRAANEDRQDLLNRLQTA